MDLMQVAYNEICCVEIFSMQAIYNEIKKPLYATLSSHLC